MTLDELVVEITKTAPHVRVESKRFASGATSLDIVCGNRFFVIQHVPGKGYGFSEIKDEHDLSGHDMDARDPLEIWRWLREQLSAC